MLSSPYCLGFSSADQRTTEYSRNFFLVVTCTDVTIICVHLCSLIVLNLEVLSPKSIYIASVRWQWQPQMHVDIRMYRPLKPCGYSEPNCK